MKQDNVLLENALIYAGKAGWKVFPCKLDKSPYTPHGCKDATTDPEQIKKWWAKWPDASIGCACGPDSGIWVMDIDLPEGPESLKRILSEHGQLPETRIQKTGSGGLQYFFSWNGTKITNTAGKIGKNIDTRGDGGYVILPPSNHPSGGAYEWIKRVEMPHAPEWLSKLISKNNVPVIDHRLKYKNKSAYGAKALAGEIVNLSNAGEGGRNNALNLAAMRMGQLIAGGEIDEGHVLNSLLVAACTIGLKETEARKTIQSGFQAGFREPRKAPELPERDDDSYYDCGSDDLSNLSNLSNISKSKHDLSESKHNLSSLSNNPSESGPKPPHNILGIIREFVENSSGSFTTRDIDSEFGLKTRKEKNARSYALNYMARKRFIYKDKSVAGKWHIIDSKIEWVDLDAPAEESFPIILPFDLHKHTIIPPKSIIILAGSTNAGKTALMLNTLKLNRCQKYKKIYLMSEMGRGEYVSRLKKFNEPLDSWKCINAAERSYDFNGAIEHHNKDGLTCIDYLEEIQGEYFKIASNIRDIYDSLGAGVAMIAIQKKKDESVARGGEGTMEKSRLYMALDYLATREHSIVCALKITKLKNFTDRNLQNHELHFEITRGAEINVVMDWTPCHKINRAFCQAEYERTNPHVNIAEKDYVVTFRTDAGRIVGILDKDFQSIVQNYGSESGSILERISTDSYNKPFIKDKSWYMQVTGILAKKMKA